MAHLFGFNDQNKSYDYYCYITETHDHLNCLESFSKKLNYFFFGEHLTRKTYFSYAETLTTTQMARTIYPGNYITHFEGLKYAIPFGELRLRMSGPTTGRLIQTELKEQFVSINLPMLHNRTLQSEFEHEFRPGVEAKEQTEENEKIIDLGDEFERQFFGDLMLFSVARLPEAEQFSRTLLIDTFTLVEQELIALYENKHNNVEKKCDELIALLEDKTNWWNHLEYSDDLVIQSKQRVQQFINTVRYNFDKQSPVYKHIQSASYRQQKIEQMIEVLLNYRSARNAWDDLIEQCSPG